MIRIRMLSTNNIENTSVVEGDILEQIGSVQRVKETFVMSLAQRYDTINDALLAAVMAKLEESGLTPFPMED